MRQLSLQNLAQCDPKPHGLAGPPFYFSLLFPPSSPPPPAVSSARDKSPLYHHDDIKARVYRVTPIIHNPTAEQTIKLSRVPKSCGDKSEIDYFIGFFNFECLRVGSGDCGGWYCFVLFFFWSSAFLGKLQWRSRSLIRNGSSESGGKIRRRIGFGSGRRHCSLCLSSVRELLNYLIRLAVSMKMKRMLGVKVKLQERIRGGGLKAHPLLGMTEKPTR